jgi:hypothetical protein
VDFDGNTATIVENGDRAVFTIDSDFDMVHGRIADLVIRSVDQNFVKYFVQTWNNPDIPNVSQRTTRCHLKTIISFSESYTHIC